MAKLRLGIIGAGSWTVSSHLPNLERHRGRGRVHHRQPARSGAAAADRGATRLRAGDRRTGTRSSPRGPTSSSIGSPPGFHCEQAKAALEAGAHVMCEKPFTIDPADAWDLDATVRRTGRQLFIAYGWNYRPMVIEAHRLMHEDGGLGEIEHVALHMDSVTRELLSETGAYPDAAPRVGPRADTWSRPETSRRRLRPGPADPPSRRLAVADRPARAGRLRADDRAARRAASSSTTRSRSATRAARSGR